MLTKVGYILQLLLRWDLIEALANGELTINSLLRDVKVLDIKEALLANALKQYLRELLLAFGSTVQREVDRQKVG